MKSEKCSRNIPAEYAWNPIDAEGYMHINCLWVSGSLKGHGYANDLLQEMKKQIAMSKVQTNPYRSVLAWFLTKFKDYDSYKDYFMEDDTATTEVAAA